MSTTPFHHIADSLSRGIDLSSYVREGNLNKPEGFGLWGFEIDIEQRQFICRAGKKTKWIRAKPGGNNLTAPRVQVSPSANRVPAFQLESVHF